MNVILSFCDKSYIVQVMLIIKYVFKLACYLTPLIIIIITSIHLFKIVMNGKDDDLKDALKVSVKRIIAGLVIFFLPAMINYVFTSLIKGNEVNFIACFESASKEKVASLKAKEEAEEAREKKSQEKEDEKLLKEAYEKEQKQKGAKKESFEEWKERTQKERENNNTNNYSNLTGTAWTNQLLNEAKSVTDYARNNNFSYGDAPINPAINHDAKLVSCDRCVAWFLYNMGYTNQPESHGVVVSTFPSWCEQNGFKKITNVNELQAGDVVFVNPDSNGSPGHVYLLGNKIGDGLWERYDCGSVNRIRLTGQYSSYSSQPFHEGIGNFMYAYRAKEAIQ
jgi:hypothetical protein